MSSSEVRFPVLAAKTMVCHTITYCVVGALAAYFLHYAEMMAKPESGMRPMTSAWVMAGPLFQPLRGLVFASVFYPLRGCLFGRKHGWLVVGWMLVGLGILSTFGPASGSIEGIIYTPTPVLLQLRGWLEVVPQAALFASLMAYWVEHPGRVLNWLLGTVFAVLMVLPALGLLARR